MSWPLAWRTDLVAAQAECTALKAELAEVEARRQWNEEAVAARIAAVDRHLEAGENERRILTDRIALLSGQPPIYERAAPVVVVQPAASGPMPEAKRLVTFDDVHTEARRAIKDGSFDVLRGRVN